MNSILDNIKADALKRIDPTNSNLHIEERTLKAGEKITAASQVIPVNQETIMVFADDLPKYNWGHPSRYLLYNANTGEFYKEIDSRFPPYLSKLPETYKPVHDSLTWPPDMRFEVELENPERIHRSNKYALLYSGASNNRHVNDLEYLYRYLIYFNYAPENIYVLNYNGTTRYSSFHPPTDIWPGDHTPYRMKVNAEGTKSELLNAMDELKGRLKKDDTLLIHTSNHGAGPSEKDGSGKSESSLVSYSPNNIFEALPASEFGSKLAEFPEFAQMAVMMEQCHSGGFASHVTRNSKAAETCFIAACQEDECSKGGKNFDVCSFAWMYFLKPFNSKDSASANSRASLPNPKSAFEIGIANVAGLKENPFVVDSPEGCGANIIL